jgi:hypothetical protein
MRNDLLIVASAGLVAGHAINKRAPADLAAQAKKWHPITTNPSFFNLKVDCGDDLIPNPPIIKRQVDGNCALEGYGIRLEDNQVIATPYERWYDPKVATFFVDDDTALYTVSTDPFE